MNEIDNFSKEVQNNIKLMSKDRDFLGLSNIWNILATQHKYAYNFSWLGRPIMQTPMDIYAYQELIWRVKPDLIIETGVAHGGSLILCANMLASLDYCENIPKNNSFRKVIGIDIEIRPHNKESIKNHPLSNYIELIEGSSADINIIKAVTSISKFYHNIMVFLDSNHTHEHVLEELKAYAPLVSIGSYIIVWDTGIEDLPDYINKSNNRPWGKGNSPKTAVHEYLKTTDNFEIDKMIEYKLMITSVKDGFLRRIK